MWGCVGGVSSFRRRRIHKWNHAEDAHTTTNDSFKNCIKSNDNRIWDTIAEETGPACVSLKMTIGISSSAV